MKFLSAWISSKIVPQIVIAVLSGSMIATSVVAAVRINKSGSRENVIPVEEVREVSDSHDSGNGSEGQVQNTENFVPVPEPGASGNTTGAVSGTVFKKAAVTAQTPTAVQNTDQSKCFITVSGNQYDVTALRSSHPGGDVFVCNSDMTAAFQKAHGSNISMLSSYLVSAGSAAAASGTVTAISGSNSSITSSFDDGGDHESEEEKSRYIKEEHYSDVSEDD